MSYLLIYGTLAMVLVLIGFELLARAVVQMVVHVRLGAPDPHRVGPTGPRLRTMVKESIGSYPDTRVGVDRGCPLVHDDRVRGVVPDVGAGGGRHALPAVRDP